MIARTLIVVWIGLVDLVGLLLLPSGHVGVKWVLTGVLMLGIAGAAFYLNQRLATGDPVARISSARAAGVYLILLLISATQRRAAAAAGDGGRDRLLPLDPAGVQRYFERRSA